MSDTPEENRIELSDHSDGEAPETSEKMSEGQGTTESATQENKGGANPPEEGSAGKSEEKGSWLEKPESLGNATGDKIQGALNPVGKYVGSGLGAVGGPVGGLVDPLVGGVMKGGKAFGNQAGVGFGNDEGGPGKAAEAEGERMKQPVGGKEQTGENPLGLS